MATKEELEQHAKFVAAAEEAITLKQIEKDIADGKEANMPPGGDVKLDDFEFNHPEFRDKNAEKMREELDKQLKEYAQLATAEANQNQQAQAAAEPEAVTSKGEETSVQLTTPKAAPGQKNKNNQDIIDAYNKEYMKDGEYSEGHEAPTEGKDGQTNLKFKDNKEAGQFFEKMAKDNKAFKVADKEGHLLAYSNGKDGKLYGPKGTELDTGGLVLNRGGDFGKIDAEKPVMAAGYDINNHKAGPSSTLGQPSSTQGAVDTNKAAAGVKEAAQSVESPKPEGDAQDNEATKEASTTPRADDTNLKP